MSRATDSAEFETEAPRAGRTGRLCGPLCRLSGALLLLIGP